MDLAVGGWSSRFEAFCWVLRAFGRDMPARPPWGPLGRDSEVSDDERFGLECFSSGHAKHVPNGADSR
jgi:hypothetical protein